ncbi:MAG: hypothetical protein EOM41_06015 [Bacilli bacterium]|nr:hypothetical protein [Bacilli bacterium]
MKIKSSLASTIWEIVEARNIANCVRVIKPKIELCYFLISRLQAEKLHWSFSLIKTLDNG